MTVNETYFLREEYQFKCLVDSILPEIIRRRVGSDAIRIWCIPSSSAAKSRIRSPCSSWKTGQGLTSGMSKSSPRISTPAFCAARGRAAIRPARCSMFRELWLKKYFKSVGDEYQLSDDLRQAVEFTRVNLAEPADTLNYRNFDVIFCRNLLIYFDDVSRNTAAEPSTKR